MSECDTAGCVMCATDISCSLPLHNLYFSYLVLMVQIPDGTVFNWGSYQGFVGIRFCSLSDYLPANIVPLGYTADMTISVHIFANSWMKSSPNKLIHFKTLHHCK